MSDIKMSECCTCGTKWQAIPPVYSSKHQGMQNALFDGNNTVIGIMDSKIEAEALADMINSHDILVEQNKALKTALEGLCCSPHTRLTKHVLLEVSEADIDAAIKALEQSK